MLSYNDHLNIFSKKIPPVDVYTHHRPIVESGGSRGGFLNINHNTSSLCMIILCTDTIVTKEKYDM